MKRITVVGKYIGAADKFGTYDGGKSYGNLLYFPAMRAREVALQLDCDFFSAVELPPEKADAVLFADLTPELLRLAETLPERVERLLLVAESPIYAPLSHSVLVLARRLWRRILTWNRGLSAPEIVHYDIPIAGVTASAAPEAREYEPAADAVGAAVSSFKAGDNLGDTARRDKFYLELARRGLLDLYGRGWRDPSARGPVEDKLAVLNAHPFGLAVENSWHPGYVTEKLPDILLSGVPAIYRGDFPTAARRFPGAYVELPELTVPAFLAARARLLADYPRYRAAALKCRAGSDDWCDSFLAGIRKIL